MRERERGKQRRGKQQSDSTVYIRVAFILKACKFVVASASCPECKREENDEEGKGGGGGGGSLRFQGTGKAMEMWTVSRTPRVVYPFPFPSSLLHLLLLPPPSLRLPILRRLNISTMAKPSTTSIFNYYLRTNGWVDGWVGGDGRRERRI